MTLVAHDGTYAELGDDLLVPKSVTISDDSELDGDLTVEIHAEFSELSGRYRVGAVHVTTWNDGTEIGMSSLRAIRVQELMREGLAEVVEFYLKSGDSWSFPLDPELARAVVKAGPSSIAAMEWVSRIYRLADAIRMRPAKAVQDQLGLSVPNASVWIRRARDRGFLPQASASVDEPHG